MVILGFLAIYNNLKVLIFICNIFINIKYILKIDVLLKTNTWIFGIIENEHIEEQFKRIEMYYKSGQYKNLFDDFPVVVVIGSKKASTVNKNISYQLLEYEKVKEWKFAY
ncbi:hypothetical protein [Clostridium sporogenes]|uniref:hypothetical protein n=2 Tax=Clostridium sporogenes TaxID=1509 RepID=UPI001FAD9CCF|nr:hypothetical protein [Clostridium sporogenes]